MTIFPRELSSLATVNAGPVLDSRSPGRLLDGTATEADLSSLENSVEDHPGELLGCERLGQDGHPAGGQNASTQLKPGGEDVRLEENENRKGHGNHAGVDDAGVHEGAGAAEDYSEGNSEFVSNSSDHVAEDEESGNNEAREGFWDASSRLQVSSESDLVAGGNGNRHGKWTMYEDDDGNAYYHNR